MTNRMQWRFPYQAGALVVAATERREHHAGRLKWWEGKNQEVKATIRAEGIDIDESVSNMTSNAYRGSTVQIRADLARDLQECGDKVREHRAKVAEYDGWVEVLGSQMQTSIHELDHDDWLFFFSGHGGR
jgi:hypothetical protein